MNSLRNWACILVLVLMSSLASAEYLVFGVVPQQSVDKLARLWTPVTSYLSHKTGKNITFSTAPDIPTFERRLLEGAYDIAYMNPYHYTVFHQKPGYLALAKQQGKKLKGIVVVPKNSSIQSLSELKQKQVAFPSPAAFAASVLPRAKMAKEGIVFSPQYVSSHDSVYLTVSKGLFPAGGGVMRTFNNTDPNVRKQLRVLWETPGYTPHAIAVHPDLNKDTGRQVQMALVNMATDPQGQTLLKSLNFTALEAAQNKDWDDVRSLNIHLLQHLLE